MRAHVERALGAHYELDCEIGRGGMGIVYRAKDRRLKRVVAIKVLPPELAFRGDIKMRFLREAETAAQLNHPNIVDIYSVDELQGLVFFVMAYIPGDNLAKRLHEHGAMPIEDTRRILRDVADALAYAHERGVVHRDIKPDNILIDEGSGRPMVTDFGIARAVSDGDNRLTATGIAIGTPTYMSPEQAAGDREIDGRSDLYALGVVAYQMLTGQPPFVASSTPAMLVKHLSERPAAVEQRRADVPRDLARVVMTLLEKDPAARFSSAAMMVKVLDGTAQAARESTSGPAEARSSYAFAQPAPAQLLDMKQMPGLGFEVAMPGAATFGDRGSFTGQYPMPVSQEEMRRWEAPAVTDFRRKLAPYLYVNAVIIVANIVTGKDFVAFTVMWTIYMAWKYAKLWSNGYDWRDVFRQPREREIVDVVEDSVGYMKAMFDKNERARLRSERQSRALAARHSGSMPMPGMPLQSVPIAPAGQPVRPTDASMSVVRQAQADRDDILRMISRMTPDERAQVPDVGRSASLLADKVQSLAYSLADLDRSAGSQTATSLEAEIARLEGDANPLDVEASETRVKRLAFLKRQRRGLVDVVERRRQIAGKLETCASALASMKLDLNRLSVGSQTYQNITSLANEAMSLARSVDHVLSAADEVGRLTSDRPAPRAI
ncbi:MAG TPA: serine/threonine-protein kinase [Gemmatimonadaceae bacterium]|nr:serine/threonine-protein kinase [Gemmatimonadaceae bacterium]